MGNNLFWSNKLNILNWRPYVTISMLFYDCAFKCNMYEPYHRVQQIPTWKDCNAFRRSGHRPPRVSVLFVTCHCFCNNNLKIWRSRASAMSAAIVTYQDRYKTIHGSRQLSVIFRWACSALLVMLSERAKEGQRLPVLVLLPSLRIHLEVALVVNLAHILLTLVDWHRVQGLL